jgi:hypothetical protein
LRQELGYILLFPLLIHLAILGCATMNSLTVRVPTRVAQLLHRPHLYAQSATFFHLRRTFANSSRSSRVLCSPDSLLFVKRAATSPTASVLIPSREYTPPAQKPATTRLLDQFNVQQKVFIVTGGGRGLGLKMAEGIAEAGGKGTCPSLSPLTPTYALKPFSLLPRPSS